jgi:hypothetical protein
VVEAVALVVTTVEAVAVLVVTENLIHLQDQTGQVLQYQILAVLYLFLHKATL